MRVYRFAAKFRYPEDAALYEHQLTLAHRHRNKLVELERSSRDQYRALIKEHGGGDLGALTQTVETLSSEIESLVEQIALFKKKGRTTVIPPELKHELAAKREARKVARAQIGDLKKRLRLLPEVEAGTTRINETKYETIRQVRKHYSQDLGLYWPNYLDNERFVGVAAKSSTDPKFKRWNGEGALAIQFQRGLGVAELHQCTDSRLQLIAPAEWLHYSDRANGSIRGPARHVKAKYRIESCADGSPRWVVLEVTAHRALPAGGRIKWAHLSRRKKLSALGKEHVSIVDDYDYHLSLTVDEPSGNHHRACGTVALELGWRLMDKGLRVAVALDEDGRQSELYLPPDWLFLADKVENLQALIDRKTLAMAESELQSHSAGVESDSNSDHKSKQQQSAARVANHLLRRYHQEPSMRKILAAWRSKHLHLERYKKGLHSRLLRRRKDIYCNWVARLAGQYGQCVIAKMDLRFLAVHRPEKESLAQPIRRLRQLAALSELRGLLSNKMEVLELAINKAKCHHCGATEEWENGESIFHRCEKCGEVWDQDTNAAANLLANASAPVMPKKQEVLAIV